MRSRSARTRAPATSAIRAASPRAPISLVSAPTSARWLTGLTANRAAVEDGVLSPGDTVPNEYYVVDERHRLLTYRVAPGARASVVTTAPGGLRSTRVAVAELAEILKGRSPKRRRLMTRRFGFWIRVAGDAVRSLDQQYQP